MNQFYPPNEDFKMAVEKVMDEILVNKIFDVNWNNYFYYRTVFEDIAVDLITCTPGSGTQCPSTGVDPDGLILNTEAATTGNFADVEKTPLAESGLKWDKRQRMRLGFRLPSIAKQTIYMVRGSTNLASPYYGFKVIDNILYGVSYDKTTEKTISLGSILADKSYVVEVRLTPSDKIIFLVNRENEDPTDITKRGLIERGVITINLPKINETITRGFYNFRITTNENVGKTLIVAFFEYIQLK